MLKIRIGLNNNAVITASQIRIAIAGILKAGRLKLYFKGVYGRGGVLAILGVFMPKLKARGGVIKLTI